MSEEEILNILENYDNEDNLSKIHKAIQGLLELYKKQQKEIEYLKEVKEHYENSRIAKDKIKEKINYYDERGYIEIAGAFKLLLEEN